MVRAQHPPGPSNVGLACGTQAPADLRRTELVVGSERFVVISYPCAPERPLPGLSPAENAVVRGANTGLSNQEIAAHRRCSVFTVQNQLASAYRKLRVSSRGELAALIAALEPDET